MTREKRTLGDFFKRRFGSTIGWLAGILADLLCFFMDLILGPCDEGDEVEAD